MNAHKETQITKAVEVMGHMGRMISGSKSGYDRDHPGNVVVFNANLCTRSSGKVWFGDLDVTRDKEKLIRLSLELGEPVYVLREHDARFDTEAHPQFDRARAIATASDVQIAPRSY